MSHVTVFCFSYALSLITFLYYNIYICIVLLKLYIHFLFSYLNVRLFDLELLVLFLYLLDHLCEQ